MIVPCYRHELYVQDCLKSIMAQTYQNIELIVCDDCSPDASFQKILEMKDVLERRFTKVILIQNEKNQGVTKNLNKMIQLSSGEYIKDIASDDMLMPNCIEDLVDYIESNPCDIAYSNCWLIDDSIHWKPEDIYLKKTFYDEVPKSGYGLTGSICEYNFISSPAAIYPRKTFEKYGLYDESLMIEDYEYMLRVSVDGKFGYLDKKTIYYRVSEESLSHFDGSDESLVRFRKVNECRVGIFEKYESYCNEIQKTRFFNDNVALAISVNDKKTLTESVAALKERNLRISNKNKVKILIYKIGLYRLLRQIYKR